MEATSFSEQAPAARRDYFAGSNSGVGDGRGEGGIVDAARILVRQDVRDVGYVVEKFTAPRVLGVTSRSGASLSDIFAPRPQIARLLRSSEQRPGPWTNTQTCFPAA
jgi:hypothetical protein